METHRGQCAEGGSAALRPLATARSGGEQKSAHRAVAGAGGRSNHFTESLRTKVGTRGIRAYRVRANARAGSGADGEVGQETQEGNGKENPETSGLEAVSAAARRIHTGHRMRAAGAYENGRGRAFLRDQMA